MSEIKNKICLLLPGYLYILLFIGCSTQKNTPAGRAYHELTTRYNIYFNAEEAYHEILKTRTENFRDDYAGLLPFYPPISATGETVAESPFDPVIEKTGKAIGEHSITAKPRRDPSKAHSQAYRQWLRQEEFNPFLKNVWLLRGKAFLQNGNYDEALSIFSGMLRLYSHDRALTDETEIWMLRTYTEMGRSYEAGKVAYTLMNKQLPKRLEHLFTEHYSYFLIRGNEWTMAIPYLRKTIAQEPDRSRKRRVQFLLGQLYAMTGDKEMAYRAFEAVKGLHTPFEITFNATLWQSALTSGEPQHKIMRRLKKMVQKVSDTDSTAFADQRYRIYLKSGNDSLAQAFRPPKPDNNATLELTTTIAATDATTDSTTWDRRTSRNNRDDGDNLINPHNRVQEESKTNGDIKAVGEGRAVEKTPQRLPQGRTLAENAALHRQWRSRNGLWQSRPDNPAAPAGGKEVTPPPFSADKSGPHSLLLPLTGGAADKNRLLFITADFNFTHFKLRQFNASYIFLPSTEALRIEPFGSPEEASHYLEIMHSDSLFRAALPTGITPVIISEENLQYILSEEKLEEYNRFYAENIAPPQAMLQPAGGGTTETKDISSQEAEKIVSLESPPERTAEPKELPVQPELLFPSERETAETVKRKLEENAAKALQQQQETAPRKNREQLRKERERQREETIRQRERELKERQRQREAALKQRERERKQQRRSNGNENSNAKGNSNGNGKE